MKTVFNLSAASTALMRNGVPSVLSVVVRGWPQASPRSPHRIPPPAGTTDPGGEPA